MNRFQQAEPTQIGSYFILLNKEKTEVNWEVIISRKMNKIESGKFTECILRFKTIQTH